MGGMSELLKIHFISNWLKKFKNQYILQKTFLQWQLPKFSSNYLYNYLRKNVSLDN